MAIKPGAPGTLAPAEVPELDDTLLSDEERAKLDKQAASEVDEQIKIETRKAYIAAAKKRILTEKRGKRIKGEAVRKIKLNLPPFYPIYIALDGHKYYHGVETEVAESVYAVLMEQQGRAWDHYDEVRGAKDPNAHRRPGAYATPELRS